MVTLTNDEQDSLAAARNRIALDLQTVLDQQLLPSPLKEAVHHAVMLGGKRIRPALTYATAIMHEPVLNIAARRAAVAVELIHCYSLVHDDLPCMDDDELRRGQPTCHKAYGEATALLAGDILQTLAFEVLNSNLFSADVEPTPHDMAIGGQQSYVLAQAANRMVQGQVLDLQAEKKTISQTDLETIHLNKTGALIQAAIGMGALSVGIELRDSLYSQLIEFGGYLGLAYQIQDDILDVTASTDALGKTAGADQRHQKATYPALLGVGKAIELSQDLHQRAFTALQNLPYSAKDMEPLQGLARFLLNREN
ncbi:polyprenyl synthetase family protein [Alkanindiges sp. WGS2144]|uniref:polyprenyl synthetase family protein n=1 Tax=Alkanindiges sp. WGS2144 TaxID=3366808 RepID=UPI0037524BCE